jgi:hypothetical protein
MSGLRLDVRSDLRQAVFRLELKSKRLIDAATVTALNRTITSTQTEANRKIRERYSLRASAVRKQMRIGRASKARLFAELIVTGRRIPLVEFSARQNSKGVSVKVTRERKTVKTAFIARMKSGHVGVFARTSKKRLPIEELFSISLPRAFTQKQILAAVRKKAAERFPIEFERAAKFGGRGG